MSNNRQISTLLLVHQKPRVLLALKKRGFGVGRWNGMGGKVKAGETLLETAIRETQEESQITPLDAVEIGQIDFEFEGDPLILEVHIFKATKFDGTPTETEEMQPQWFDESEIPFDQMWPDDKHWVPLFLADKRFSGKILFKDKDTIIDTKIQINE